MGFAEKPWFRRLLVYVAGNPLLKDFEKKTKKLQKTQKKLLKNILKKSRNTVFGKEHNFDKIRNIADFKRNVPVGDFETHRPYINRMMKGEEDVLFPGKPLIYNTSSGTTSKPKMIPISKEYLKKSQTKLNKIWLYSCVKENPDIYNGKSLSAVAPEKEGEVEDGTPFGSISGHGYKNIPAILKSTYCGPYSLICIKDYQKKFYAMVRCALANDITIIISPSPSNILRFHQTVMDEFDDLVKDIENGTMRKDVLNLIPEDDHKDLYNYIKPDKKRAENLKKLKDLYGRDLKPKHYWPNIALINIWKQGNFSLMVPRLDDFFPEKTVFRAFGYQASEGRAGLVLKNNWNYSVLAHHIYFFEFIEESERNKENPETLLPHQLKVGKRYFIIFTNGSGLYRYDMNDIIEICGYYNEVPLFKFIQKGEGITSITGEKLSEIQIIEAVKEVSGKLGINIQNYVMYCDIPESQYRFYVEFDKKTSKAIKRDFNTKVDRILCKMNLEYEVKRGSKRLDLPILYDLPEKSYEKIKEYLVKKNAAREGQYKELYLSKKAVTLEALKQIGSIINF